MKTIGRSIFAVVLLFTSGLPAAMDQLLAQPPAVPVLSISSSGTRLMLTASGAQVGKPVVVQWSTNLVDWVEIRSLPSSNSNRTWYEVQQTGVNFYRLIQDPGPQKLIAAGIYQAMKTSDVQGLSITVVTNDQVAWERGFGHLAKGRPERVDTKTLFQAASISKPTTTLAALRMVEQGQLSLDEPVNNKLKLMLIPGKNATNVTLRRILSHTGGLTGFFVPGYEVGSPIPTLLQILEGQPPANTPPVVANGPIGTWAYSPGGFTFLQALLVDVSGQEFPDLMRALVLDPLGMNRSTFEQPLPTNLQLNAASGHVGGEVVKGNWHIYPELAAGGLWTTSSDLARMFMAIRSAYLGRPGSLIKEVTAAEMLTSQAVGTYGPWGLGIALEIKGGQTVGFTHPGTSEGFRCAAITFLDSGDGVAIMGNSGTSDPSIVSTVYNACATAYGWPLNLL